jgi:inorganic pyrophosphatase
MADLNQLKFFIEIPAGSSVKYEVDEDTGELTADRFLFTSEVYPANYGFIKDTRAEDGDPADIVLLSSQPLVPGCVIKGKVIGMLEMEDEEGIDHKFVGVPMAKVDPMFGVWQDITDIPEATRNRIKHFFETYKTLEPGKWVKVKNWIGRKQAEEKLKLLK